MYSSTKKKSTRVGQVVSASLYQWLQRRVLQEGPDDLESVLGGGRIESTINEARRSVRKKLVVVKVESTTRKRTRSSETERQ